ncbi:V-set domain-containing T-cell activation inhibitor 1 [Rhinatrema bivittatum]|uniref:V-set domain-containing T-cell activation inhibitor 1 n=1 Tax=Rhinatrema bivittatum TaxID=194408 RepID=UPI00112CE82A|nr:V-set domain-containing T-cell activation inhibitor 1 [Rhinatrema bivittatum]
MIAIIIILATAIALIIGFGVAGNNAATVSTLTSVGMISNDGILSCIFVPDIKQGSVIQWEKTGLSGTVLRYENGKEDRTKQNPAFKGRVQFFLNQVVSGNASLLMKNVQLSDAGTYKCTVTTSAGTGNAKLDFRVGDYSPVDVENVTGGALQCTSDSWYPKPSVTWLNTSSGENLTRFSETSFQEVFDNAVEVVSLLKNVALNGAYSCVIENQIARGTSYVIVTDSGMKKKAQLDILTAASQPSHHIPFHCLLIPILTYCLTLS